MRHRLFHPRTSIACLVVCALTAGGCDRGSLGLDMYDQPRHEPNESSDFFTDGQSARPLVAGTVAREEVYPDRASSPGQGPASVGPATGGFPPGFPTEGEPLRERLGRGQHQYNIYCAVCHGYNGQGDGMIVQRGFTKPPSFVLLDIDQQRDPQRYAREQFLQTAPASHVYNAITNGFGGMYSYGERVSPKDRWAIAAYVKVLQQAKPDLTAPLPTPPGGGGHAPEKAHP